MAASRFEHDYDFLFRLVIIGDPAVGKSSILLRFAVSCVRDMASRRAALNPAICFSRRMTRFQRQ